MNCDIKEICRDIRCDTATCVGHLGWGRIGGCLPAVELLAVLYFEEMRIDPKNPKMAGRDRFICSKGHAGPAVYATLANRGYFDKELLLTLNQGGTSLPSHWDMNRTIGVGMTRLAGAGLLLRRGHGKADGGGSSRLHSRRRSRPCQRYARTL